MYLILNDLLHDWMRNHFYNNFSHILLVYNIEVMKCIEQFYICRMNCDFVLEVFTVRLMNVYCTVGRRSHYRFILFNDEKRGLAAQNACGYGHGPLGKNPVSR